MPTWHSLLNEIKARGSTYDVVRRERLKALAEKTGRNVIVYYSGWLQKPKFPGTQVTDADKNGFVTVIVQRAPAPPGPVVLRQDPDADVPGQCARGEGEDDRGINNEGEDSLTAR